MVEAQQENAVEWALRGRLEKAFALLDADVCPALMGIAQFIAHVKRTEIVNLGGTAGVRLLSLQWDRSLYIF